jgi:hypothetical protein
MDVPVQFCATCGRLLTGDPDEDPRGDAGRPICGECERNNNFLDIDAADGTLDDNLDNAYDGAR